MFTVPVTRVMRAGCVLLGGSGRARMPTMQTRPLAALLRPSPHDLVYLDHIADRWVRITKENLKKANCRPPRSFAPGAASK